MFYFSWHLRETLRNVNGVFYDHVDTFSSLISRRKEKEINSLHFSMSREMETTCGRPLGIFIKTLRISWKLLDLLA